MRTTVFLWQFVPQFIFIIFYYIFTWNGQFKVLVCKLRFIVVSKGEEKSPTLKLKSSRQLNYIFPIWIFIWLLILFVDFVSICLLLMGGWQCTFLDITETLCGYKYKYWIVLFVFKYIQNTYEKKLKTKSIFVLNFIIHVSREPRCVINITFLEVCKKTSVLNV